MKAILLWLLCSTSLLPAFYVSPAEGVLLFRQDTLGLDANRQKILSKDFLTLARRPNALESPHQRRATAQLIALAANLDPKAKGPQNLSRMLANPEEESLLIEFDFEEQVQNIANTSLYLLQDSDNKNHTAVAQLFLDPLTLITPELAVVSARPNSEESPRWTRVVAPLEDFIKRKEVTPSPDENKIAPNEPEAGQETKEGKEPQLEVADFQGSIQVPLFLQERTAMDTLKTYPRVASLELNAELTRSPSRIIPPAAHESKTLSESFDRMRSNLARSYSSSTLSGIKGTLSLRKKAKYLERNRHNLTLPMTILAEGLLSERQPVSNLVVLGDLSASGEITAPKNSWQFLEILLTSESTQTRRLLVAPEFRPLLEAVLTQQREDFFFNFDVFEIRTLDDAYELSFENSAPETTEDAFAKFQEIRRVGEGKTTSVFVANPHVLTRLAEVKEIEPRCLSATLLHLRGSGQTPDKYATEVLASMIQTALMPMAKIPYANSRNLEPESLEKIHDQCRANLDPLTRNVAIKDRELFGEALDLANRIRTLARAKDRYDKEEYSGSDSFHLSLFFNTFKSIQKEFYQLALKTSKLLGLDPPVDPRLFRD